MADMMNRLLAAMNAHDLDAFVACFAADYDSEQPAHPNRAFRGSDQVRKNWEGVFAGVPDFTAELVLRAVTDDGVEVGEWRWRGTHTDGSPFRMRGVIVTGARDDQIAWGRLYMEPVEQGGTDINEMVQETYRPSA
jgi:ketosteroid isomerase-like protein